MSRQSREPLFALSTSFIAATVAADAESAAAENPGTVEFAATYHSQLERSIELALGCMCVTTIATGCGGSSVNLKSMNRIQRVSSK